MRSAIFVKRMSSISIKDSAALGFLKLFPRVSLVFLINSALFFSYSRYLRSLSWWIR